jgi:hypothetical protein
MLPPAYLAKKLTDHRRRFGGDNLRREPLAVSLPRENGRGCT